MTKQTRTILFIFFVLLFVLTVIPTIFYAQGYRFDTEHWRIVKTGALFLSVRPQPVRIVVDDKAIETTNFFFRNAFLSDLLPKTYRVEALRDGYYSWHKELDVTPGNVTKAFAVRLFAQNPRNQIVRENVSSFFPADNGVAAIISTTVEENSTTLWLYLHEAKQVGEIVKLQAGEQVQKVVWSHDTAQVLIVLKKGNEVRALVGSTLAPHTFSFITSFLTPSLLKTFGQQDARLQWGYDGATLYVVIPGPSGATKTTDELYLINLISHTVKGPILDEIHDFLVLKNGVYTIEGPGGTFVRYSTDLATFEQISPKPYPGDIAVPLRLTFEEETFFIIQSSNLFIYEEGKKEFSFVETDVVSVAIHPDKKKLAIQKEHEILLYWLQEVVTAPKHKKGEIELVLRLSTPIEHMTWLSPYEYLAITTGDALQIVEIDPRDGKNILTYDQFASLDPISWYKKNKSFLLLQKKDLIELFIEQTAS